MKMIIKSVIAVLIGLASLASVQLGHAQSKRLPIYSVGAGVGNNLMLIDHLEGSVWASSMLYSNGLRTYFGTQYAHEGVPTKEGIGAIVRSQPLTFKLADASNDWVSVYLAYSTANYETLFWGASSFKLEPQINGSWRVPSGAGAVTVYLGANVLISEKGAVSAVIHLRNANGNVIDYVDVPVKYNEATDMGLIRFPSRYLGQRGELIVYYAQRDSEGQYSSTYTAAFDMDGDGSLMNPASGATSIEPDFAELMTRPSSNVQLTDVQSYDHKGVSPLVQFTVASPQTVTFRARTTEGEDATTFTLKKLVRGQNNEPIRYTIPAGSSLNLLLDGAVYLLDYEWGTLEPYPAQDSCCRG